MAVLHSLFLSLKSALDWYEHQDFAGGLLRLNVSLVAAGDPAAVIPDNFNYLSQSEADSLLEKDQAELKLISCFQLVSAAEGWLKHDFQSKVRGVQQGSASPLVADFKSIYNGAGNEMKHVDVDRDILEAWKKHYRSQPLADLIGRFRVSMKFRHWVAHGRFWGPSSLGRIVTQYEPALVYGEIASLFNHLTGLPEGFQWQ